MKGQKIGNLYKLLENTITNGVTKSTTGESYVDDIVLWNMRLCHLGEW